jgi:hypothetical protein
MPIPPQEALLPLIPNRGITTALSLKVGLKATMNLLRQGPSGQRPDLESRVWENARRAVCVPYRHPHQRTKALGTEPPLLGCGGLQTTFTEQVFNGRKCRRRPGLVAQAKMVAGEGNHRQLTLPPVAV